MSATHEVREVSDRFYGALNRMANGDAALMGEVWSHGSGVSTMHPIGGREVGWDQVKEPWKKVAELCSGGEVRIEQQLIEVLGEAAYEIGQETGHIVVAGESVKIDQRVTNIYRRESGAWKLVHHHTDLSPKMLEILARLGAKK